MKTLDESLHKALGIESTSSTISRAPRAKDLLQLAQEARSQGKEYVAAGIAFEAIVARREARISESETEDPHYAQFTIDPLPEGYSYLSILDAVKSYFIEIGCTLEKDEGDKMRFKDAKGRDIYVDLATFPSFKDKIVRRDELVVLVDSYNL